MGFAAAPFVSIARAIAVIPVRIAVTVRVGIATMGTTFAALFAVFLDIMGGRSQRVRRGPDGVGETALDTIRGHCLPSEMD
jgi:hypothetical protein